MMLVTIVAKVTVTTALALIGAWLARGRCAAVRHALLAAAFAVMLALPVASFIAPPVRIAVPAAARDRTVLPPLASDLEAGPEVAPGEAESGVSRVVVQSPGLSISALAISLWAIGTMLSLLPMMVGLRKIRSLRRSSLPWMEGQTVVDRLASGAGIHRRVEVLLHEALAGPMTCGVARPAIVLPADARNWCVEDLKRALVHELEHVRRGDWASQCVAQAVCALYWFHPLVRMARRQLALEAERACDDAVLRRSEATAYADQLVGLARLSLVRKSPALAMANRADLAARVGAVLDNRVRRGRAGVLPVALACGAAAILILTMAPLTMVAEPQASPAQAAKPPEFDAVSVKLVDPNMRGFHSHENNDPGRLRLSGTMHMFITRAYGITSGQLSGEPDWFKNHLYSIEAVTGTRTSEEQMLLMLRGVLADRFQLRLHEEERDMPVYSLEVAPGGPKFKELKPGEVPRDGAEIAGTFARSFTSVQELTNSLNGVNGGRLTVDRTVVDRTRLTGQYNMQLRTELETQNDDFAGRTVVLPNLIHDIQSELGLKLVPDNVRMHCLVVQSAALPTAN